MELLGICLSFKRLNKVSKSPPQKTPSVMWKELLAQLGDEFLIWINAPENPVMN